MTRTTVITTFNDSPLGICGICPRCGATLRNPHYGERKPSQLRWEVQCRNCGAQVVVKNGVILQKMGLIAPEKAGRRRALPLRGEMIREKDTNRA